MIKERLIRLNRVRIIEYAVYLMMNKECNKIKFYNNGGVGEIQLYTNRTMLEILRIMFSIPPEQFIDNISGEEEVSILLFQVQLLVNQGIFSVVNGKCATPAEFVLFFTYISGDFENNDYRISDIRQNLYTYFLNEFLSNDDKGINLKSSFLARIGVNSIEEYYRTITALSAFYHRLQCKSNSLLVISDGKLPNQINKKVYKYLSLKFDEIIPYDKNYDYKFFRSHPVLQISDDSSIILDSQLLSVCLYNNLFFALKNESTEGDYFQYFTTDFVEHYLFRKGLARCQGAWTIKSISASDNRQKIDCQPDYYIRDSYENIFLFECKGFKINGELKDKCDLRRFIEQIKVKLYYNEKKKKDLGVKQLIKQIGLIEDGKQKWDSEIPKDVRFRYYPVIVLEDYKLCMPGLTALLNDWYKEALQEAQLTDVTCYPLVVMSIDTLFLYSDKFSKKGFEKFFNEFFEENSMREQNENYEFLRYLKSDFNLFMREKYDISEPIRKELFQYTNNLLNMQ
jgi:hypothetical protein